MLPPGAHVFSQKEQPNNGQAVFPDIAMKEQPINGQAVWSDIAMKEYFSYREIQFQKSVLWY